VTQPEARSLPLAVLTRRAIPHTQSQTALFGFSPFAATFSFGNSRQRDETHSGILLSNARHNPSPHRGVHHLEPYVAVF
jgi:hypothetical protein